MKKTILLGLAALVVTVFTSCNKETTINVDEEQYYKSQNYHVLSPSLGLFGSSNQSEGRIVIEGADILRSFGLTLSQSDNNSSLITKSISENGKDVQVPISEIFVSYFAMQYESVDQMTYPLHEYLEKLELIIHKTESGLGISHGQGDDHGGEAITLASLTHIDSSLSVGPGGSSLLVPFTFNLVNKNLIDFLRSSSNYYFEIVGKFKKTPDSPRFFSYNLGLTCKGFYNGKIK